MIGWPKGIETPEAKSARCTPGVTEVLPGESRAEEAGARWVLDLFGVAAKPERMRVSQIRESRSDANQEQRDLFRPGAKKLVIADLVYALTLTEDMAVSNCRIQLSARASTR